MTDPNRVRLSTAFAGADRCACRRSRLCAEHVRRRRRSRRRCRRPAGRRRRSHHRPRRIRHRQPRRHRRQWPLRRARPARRRSVHRHREQGRRRHAIAGATCSSAWTRSPKSTLSLATAAGTLETVTVTGGASDAVPARQQGHQHQHVARKTGTHAVAAIVRSRTSRALDPRIVITDRDRGAISAQRPEHPLQQHHRRRRQRRRPLRPERQRPADHGHADLAGRDRSDTTSPPPTTTWPRAAASAPTSTPSPSRAPTTSTVRRTTSTRTPTSMVGDNAQRQRLRRLTTRTRPRRHPRRPDHQGQAVLLRLATRSTRRTASARSPARPNRTRR